MVSATKAFRAARTVALLVLAFLLGSLFRVEQSASDPTPTPVAAAAEAPTTTISYVFPGWLTVHEDLADDWITSASVRCWQSIAPLQPFAQSIGVPLVCDESEYWGGAYNGVATVRVNDVPTSDDLFLQIGAHELGHGWDFTRFGPWQRQAVATILGWDSFDVEAWADVFAQGIGCWRDQGTGWRQAYTFATDTQLETLRVIGFLPTATECNDV